MKRVSACCAALLISMSATAVAADLGVNGTTIVRIEERSFPGFAKERLVPATQYLGLDGTTLADDALSLHLFGWGRADLAERSGDDKRTEGDLAYGYLRYRFPKANADLKLGRFFVNEGVTSEQLDGMAAKTDLAYGFRVSLFGGAPVRLENDNKGDYLVGGRLAYRRPGWLELGASLLHEKGSASRRFFQGVTPPVFDAEEFRQLVGADIWLSPTSMVQLTGHTSYNTAISSIAEHNYLLQIRPSKDLTISGTYTERLFKGYFAGTNLPNLFKPDPLDDSTQYGGSITYAIAAPAELSLDYRHIRRASLGGTDRFGAEVRLDLKNISSRTGVGYHRHSAPDVSTPLATTSSFSLSFHEIHGWLLHDQGRHFVGVDIIGHFYDDRNNPSLNGKSDDYEAVVTAGYRIMPNLTLSGDLSYGANALFDEEFKGLVRAEFAFNTADKGGKK